MIHHHFEDMIRAALKKAQRKGDLPRFDIPAEIPVDRPKQAEQGDLSSPVCMQLARLARMAPVDIAHQVVKRLPQADFAARVEVAHPGYLNLSLDPGWLTRQVDVILEAGERFGHVDVGGGQRVQVEFGSANPTGPMHVGFGRNLVLGDGVANVLHAAGYQVQREYYINDAGSQMEKFGESLYVRYCEYLGHDAGTIPEGGYEGQYLVDWGRKLAEDEGTRFLDMPRNEAIADLRDIGLHRFVIGSVREDCEHLGVHYDNWFSEQSLYDEGVFDIIMTLLRQGDHLYTSEGAVWFDAEALGADKDEVVIRSTGRPGYFASDIAYHYDKFVQRGFDWVIDVWGADHQGHVPRMKAMMQALDLDPERLTLLVYQLVTILESGDQIRLSKRAGTLVDLKEILDDIGPDAFRFHLAARAAPSQMDLDLDLARKESDENPVYYVQYGHARICSILRYAAEQGHSDEGADLSLLTHPAELALIKKMLELPEVVERAALELAPHHLCYYAQDLSSVFHKIFYTQCRVVSSLPEDAAITKARLRLVRAAKVALGRTLALIGISAPETM
jgi:arginyl-tRNA synthetase